MFHAYISDANVHREPFDEYEEFLVKCQHYACTWAASNSSSIQGVVRTFPKPQQTHDENATAVEQRLNNAQNVKIAETPAVGIIEVSQRDDIDGGGKHMYDSDGGAHHARDMLYALQRRDVVYKKSNADAHVGATAHVRGDVSGQITGSDHISGRVEELSGRFGHSVTRVGADVYVLGGCWSVGGRTDVVVKVRVQKGE